MEAKVNVMDNLPVQANCNQYCLKWNNHKLNISGVFERLRSEQHFCDLTLTSADQKFLRCHRLLLCAGSGFLEEVLTLNPSDHPTVILSQIHYDEMKLLVDFMYSGEVSVETGKLGKLLEAAKILKIKGLWESGLDGREEEEDGASSVDDASNPCSKSQKEEVRQQAERFGAETKEEEDELASSAQQSGGQKRKQKPLPPLIESKLVKTVHVEENESPKHSGILTPISNASNPEVYSPMFGVSNAYFLTSQDQKSSNETALNNGGKAISNNGETKVSPSKAKTLSDIPNLLAQTPIHPALITAMSPNSTTLPPFLPSLFDASNANLPSKRLNESCSSSAKPKKSMKVKPSDKPFVDANNRKYKQYTEETLQLALKEIMEGQSINRSSMRYNIPARTLRDWMKRLNIKSVFTHNQMASPPGGVVNGGSRNPSTESDCSSVTNSTNSIVKSIPGTVQAEKHHNSPDFGDGETSEDEEEEIDDDEENN